MPFHESNAYEDFNEEKSQDFSQSDLITLTDLNHQSIALSHSDKKEYYTNLMKRVRLKLRVICAGKADEDRSEVIELYRIAFNYVNENDIEISTDEKYFFDIIRALLVKPTAFRTSTFYQTLLKLESAMDLPSPDAILFVERFLKFPELSPRKIVASKLMLKQRPNDDKLKQYLHKNRRIQDEIERCFNNPDKKVLEESVIYFNNEVISHLNDSGLMLIERIMLNLISLQMLYSFAESYKAQSDIIDAVLARYELLLSLKDNFSFVALQNEFFLLLPEFYANIESRAEKKLLMKMQIRLIGAYCVAVDSPLELENIKFRLEIMKDLFSVIEHPNEWAGVSGDLFQFVAQSKPKYVKDQFIELIKSLADLAKRKENFKDEFLINFELFKYYFSESEFTTEDIILNLFSKLNQIELIAFSLRITEHDFKMGEYYRILGDKFNNPTHKMNSYYKALRLGDKESMLNVCSALVDTEGTKEQEITSNLEIAIKAAIYPEDVAMITELKQMLDKAKNIWLVSEGLDGLINNAYLNITEKNIFRLVKENYFPALIKLTLSHIKNNDSITGLYAATKLILYKYLKGDEITSYYGISGKDLDDICNKALAFVKKNREVEAKEIQSLAAWYNQLIGRMTVFISDNRSLTTLNGDTLINVDALILGEARKFCYDSINSNVLFAFKNIHNASELDINTRIFHYEEIFAARNKKLGLPHVKSDEILSNAEGQQMTSFVWHLNIKPSDLKVYLTKRHTLFSDQADFAYAENETDTNVPRIANNP